MTSDPPRPGLHPLSHLKAGPTTSSSKSTALPASANLQPPEPSPERPRLLKEPSRDDQVSATNEKATIALIRRVLYPQAGGYAGASTPQSLEGLLPPLTSSNNVDHQLYALLAIIVKEFVLSWYSKITPDQVLVNEVLQVIAHCTRALEQRFRGTDVAQLILDEIPALIQAHITSYRLAREQSQLSGSSPSLREIYHVLNPHPCFSPVPDPLDADSVSRQRENEAIYRQLLMNGALAVLLPTEDLENACLRALVGDILADLILGNQVSGKMCEGWFLWESITKLLNAVGRQPAREDATTSSVLPKESQLQKFGLLSPKEEFENRHSSKAQIRLPDWILSVLQCGYLVYVTLRFIVTGLFRVATTPPMSSTSTTPVSHANEAFTACSPPPGKRPVLDYRLYGMISQLLDIPQRMPWLGGLLALSQHLILAGPGRLGDTGSVLDRFLYETIQDYILTPTLLPNLLLASRAALFPSNARPSQAAAGTSPSGPPTPHRSVQPPASPTERGKSGSEAAGASNASSGASTPNYPATAPSLSPDQRPSAAEIASIKRQCAVSLLSRIPRPIARRFFGIPANVTAHGPPDCQGQRLNAPNEHDAQPYYPDSTRASSSSSPVPPSSNENDDPEESLLIAAIENDILDLFADDYCNRRLIYSIIEAILAKLLPELAERSITELMEDRGVALATA